MVIYFISLIVSLLGFAGFHYGLYEFAKTQYNYVIYYEVFPKFLTYIYIGYILSFIPYVNTGAAIVLVLYYIYITISLLAERTWKN